jgi:hypothetical protein
VSLVVVRETRTTGADNADSHFDAILKVSSFRKKFILKNRNYIFEESPRVFGHSIHREIPQIYHIYFLHFENLSE